MTAWELLTASSTAPAGSTAWLNLNSIGSQLRIVEGNFVTDLINQNIVVELMNKDVIEKNRKISIVSEQMVEVVTHLIEES